MDPTEKAKPMEYHLRIAGIVDSLEIDGSYKHGIDRFLASLSNAKEYQSGLERSPLKFNGQDLRLESTAISSMSVVWISLCLTDDAKRFGNTLGEATEILCQRIFDPEAESSLKSLTTFGILGLSPVSLQFNKLWTKACFKSYAMNGPSLLKVINRDFDTYLPQWALALSFAVVVGPNFGIFCNSGPESPRVMDGAPNDDVSLGSSILDRYSQLVKPDYRNPEQVCKHELTKNLQKLVIELEKATDLEGTKDQLMPNNLCNELYEATVGGAKAITSNQKYLKIFLSLPRLAETKAVGSLFAAAGKAAFTTGGALSISSWRIEINVTVTPDRFPALISTALSFAAPALVTVGFGLVVVRTYQWVKRRYTWIYFLQTANAIIIRSYRIAQERYTLLQWIHLTGRSPLTVDFVDKNSRIKWIEFIRGVRSYDFTDEDSQPRMVLEYLREQSEELRGVFNNLLASLEK